MKKEILTLLIFFIVLFNTTLILASNPFDDLFYNFNNGVISIVLSFVPLIILLVLTIIAIKKKNTILITLQFLLWWVFTIYVCTRAFIFIDLYYNLGFVSTGFADYFNTNLPTNDTELLYYQISIFINAIVGLIMSIGNNKIKKILLRM